MSRLSRHIRRDTPLMPAKQSSVSGEGSGLEVKLSTAGFPYGPIKEPSDARPGEDFHEKDDSQTD